MKSIIEGRSSRLSKLRAAICTAMAISVTATTVNAEQVGSAWYGIPLPGPVTSIDQPPVDDASDYYGTAKIAFPAPNDPSGALSGQRLWQSMEQIIAFSREDKASGSPLWGRISGTPAQKNTVQWAANRFRRAGIKTVQTDDFAIPPQWFPNHWSVSISTGSGSSARTVQLQSAIPQQNTTEKADFTAPLAFVGDGYSLAIMDAEVKGKIAVVYAHAEPSTYESRDANVPAELIKRGATGVITIVDSPGNVQYMGRSFTCPNGSCFTVGGEDGAFLLKLMAAAKAAKDPAPSAHIALSSENRSGLTAQNGYAVIPGKSDRVILVNAHSDAWFDGANDNADGLASLVALAEYFARRPKPGYTLVFVVSAGHHGTAVNGPAEFVKAHPDIAKRLALAINLESHAGVALGGNGKTMPAGSGFPPKVKLTTEIPEAVSISNLSPFLTREMARGTSVYAIPMWQRPSNRIPGDFTLISQSLPSVPMLQLSGVGEVYHSTSDNMSLVSRNGLERITAFYASLIERLDKTPEAMFAGPARAVAREQ